MKNGFLKLILAAAAAFLIAGSFSGVPAAADENTGIAPEDIIVTNDPEEFALDADDVEVSESNPFVFKRLGIFVPEGSLTDTFGAVKAAYYQAGQNYILDYETEAEAAAAYEQLCIQFGENCVMPDLPVSSPETISEPDAYTYTEALSYSWGADTMQLDLARDIANADETLTDEIVVAVLDSGIFGGYENGVYSGHEKFEGRLLESSVSMIEGTGYSMDGSSHGTHVAGIIADCTPDNVKIMMVKILDDSGKGGILELSNGIIYAVENGADIINLSVAVNMKSSPEAAVHSSFTAAENVLKQAYEAGVMCICSAGNKSQCIEDYAAFPAVSEYAFSVSAVTSALEFASAYSNYGAGLDFTAPGSGIFGASSSDASGYIKKNGTSMSCPHVSAACAMLELYNEGLTIGENIELLKSICMDLGDEGFDAWYGYGMPVFENGEVPVKDVGKAEITLSQTSYNYIGLAREPAVTVTMGSKTLQEGTDYFVSYVNNTDAGTAQVIIEGTGLYNGTAAAEFTIKRRTLSLVASAELVHAKMPYTGVPRTQTNATVVTSVLGANTFTLVKGTDYRISYVDNTDVGTATMIIKGKGNYKGTITKEFKIVPGERQFIFATAGEGRFKVFWNEDSTQITGYQLQYSTQGDFSSVERTVTFEDPSASFKTVKKGPESGKTYYVRMRAYKIIDGRKYYGKWNDAISVTVL